MSDKRAEFFVDTCEGSAVDLNADVILARAAAAERRLGSAPGSRVWRECRPYTMTATVHTDAESAERLKDAFELVAAALCEPTEENTSALFHLAAGCIVSRAQTDRDALSSVAAPKRPTPEPRWTDGGMLHRNHQGARPVWPGAGPDEADYSVETP